MNIRTALTWPAFTACIALTLAACSSSGDGSNSDGGSIPLPCAAVTITACTPAGPSTSTEDGGNTVPSVDPIRLSPAAGCTVTGDLEGQFRDSSEMPAYLQCVLPGVEAWIDAVYGSMPHPTGYYFVPTGSSGTDQGCPYTVKVLEYCNDSHNIYLGQEAVWSQYSGQGDAAPALVLAHEVTHHFQQILEMAPPRVPNDEIRYENQADCGAGAFMNYARAQGMMNKDDDIYDLAGSLKMAGEADRNPKSEHGTIAERLAAFDRAYLSTDASPMTACIEFVPETPIIHP